MKNYVFEFTSEYVKRPVRNSDNERLEREPASISVTIPKEMYQLHEMLAQYAEKHVRCVAENPYI